MRYQLVMPLLGVFLAAAATAFAGDGDADVSLQVPAFTHITFDGIPATRYVNDGAALVAHVERSSSFLVRSFDRATRIGRVVFEWRVEGGPLIKGAAVEASKEGDDAVLRVGLLVSGAEPMLGFLAPAWIKTLRGVMKLPTNRMIYLLPRAQHRPGEHWPSPYSDSIECIAVDSVPVGGGWFRSTAVLPTAFDAVGLWLMADGDDTRSTFTSWLRHLRVN